MSDEKLIVFDPPITASNVTLDSITLKEPTIAQLIAADKLSNGGLGGGMANLRTYQQALISAVSGKPGQFIGQMKISQVNEAFEFLMGFISPTQETN